MPQFDTKQIGLGGLKRIVLQDKNGPCPFLAIVNSLVLLGGLSIAEAQVSFDQLYSELQARTETDLQEFKQSLLEGLDTNPRFDGSFDDSAAKLFGLFGIQLVHGWVIPTDFEDARRFSYDKLIDSIVSDNDSAPGVIVARSFIETNPSQLSPDGIALLQSQLEEGDVVAFFRNNHFATLVKHSQQLFTLVTDQGFAWYDDIVWESLDNKFYEGNFQQRQDCSRDEKIARELQDQEDSRAQQESQAQSQPRSQPTPKSQPNQNQTPPAAKTKKGKCIVC